MGSFTMAMSVEGKKQWFAAVTSKADFKPYRHIPPQFKQRFLACLALPC